MITQMQEKVKEATFFKNIFGNHLPKEDHKAETKEFATLSNGIQMPVIGLGVMHMHGNECVRQSVKRWTQVIFRLTKKDMAAIQKMEGGRELFFEHDSPELAHISDNYRIH